MKNTVLRQIAAAMLLFLLLSIIPTEAVPAQIFWPEGIEIQSESACVMEESTGTILYQKNIDESHYPASITKIMTALIALENGDMSDTVVFSKDAVYKTEGSGIARDVGEEMTLEQCLYAMMLESANECAYAIAEHVGGTYENFVDMMNEKAKELGCTHTHFVNPHGLPDEDHYVSARDMALIAREAWKNETFRIITGTVRYQIPPTNKHKEITYLQNHNAMINNYKGSEYLYEPCVGGKTGYTIAARNTLVTYAQKDGMTLICVIMYTEGPLHYTETKELFEYCFANFGLLNVAEHETRFQATSGSLGELNTNGPLVSLSSDGEVVLPLTASFQDTDPRVVPVEEDGVVGRILYSYADREVGFADILAADPVVEPYAFRTVVEDHMVTTDGETEGEEVTQRIIEVTPQKTALAAVIILAAGILIALLIRFSSKFYLLRQKFYQWKNSRREGQLRSIRRGGFSMRRHHRRK